MDTRSKYLVNEIEQMQLKIKAYKEQLADKHQIYWSNELGWVTIPDYEPSKNKAVNSPTGG
jgi:hypothetical protein